MKIEFIGTGSIGAIQSSASVLIDDNLLIDIGNETYVTSFEVEHGNCKPAYGYIVEKDNQKVGVSGDSAYCKSIQEIVEQSNFCILDMSWMESKKAHMGLEDIRKITQTYPNKKIAATHMQDYVREQAKKEKIENLIIPEDAEILEL